MAALEPWVQREIARRAVEWGVMNGLAEYRRRRQYGGMGDLGQDMTGIVQIAVQKALAPLIPTLGAELMKAVEPAAKKASEVVGPVIDEKLRKYGPWIGVIAGTVAAILGILGMVTIGGYLLKKVG